MGKLLKPALLLGFDMSIGRFSTTLYTVFVDIWTRLDHRATKRARPLQVADILVVPTPS
jgi:hypothetical protein